MSLELKINVRHTDTGNKIRSITRFNNFTFERRFNSFASTYSFDFYFDPRDKELAEIVCVSHLHEVQIYYNGRLELTGYLLTNTFHNSGVLSVVPISGYSKPGVLNDCDIPFELHPLETDGLSLRQIINKIIPSFNLGLVIQKGVKRLDQAFTDKDVEEKSDEDIGKTASKSAENAASYLSELAKQRNIVLSHDEKGNVYITTPNTKGTPIFNFDMRRAPDGSLINKDADNDAKKIPGIKTTLTFNGQALHTDITVVQQADDEEGSNATQTMINNPLIPIKHSVLRRPKTVIMSSGTEFSVDEAAKYELGKEIREAVRLDIELSTIEKDGFMLRANNTITIIDPSVFLYTKSTWFIEAIDMKKNPASDTAILKCVLPFGYDFDVSTLKNVFVDPHKNLPRF